MKNSKIGFIGLLVAGIVAAFFVINLNETAETGKMISQEEAGENIGDTERVEEKLNTSDELKVGLQVTMAQVSPDGSSVFGGVGPPGKTVILFNGDIIIAETTINKNGDWVAVPEKPFESGSHFIQLGIKPEHGESETERLSLRVVSEKAKRGLKEADNAENLPLTPETTNMGDSSKILDTVISDLAVVIDIEENKEEKPFVVFVPKSDSSIPVVVQSPEVNTDKKETITSEDNSDIRRLRSVASVLDKADKISSLSNENEFIQIRSLSWEDKSKLRLSGFAGGGNSMRAYFDNQFIASIKWNVSEKDNKVHRWSMVTRASMQPDEAYNLRAELLDEDESVMQVTQIEISAESLEIGSDGSDMLVIHKGDALWRIAYRAYGQGVRYVDIFKRNNNRINNPDLIYPNQIFAIPD
ncbi:MAG: hypothetical protein CM15mP117_19440 [Alphaproteobacteria bacterium]|nr:MAG: hypothetical protein CM15mP117_19440 [Alphaproteobacteria bacterium]